jgi:cache domain-containing protein
MAVRRAIWQDGRRHRSGNALSPALDRSLAQDERTERTRVAGEYRLDRRRLWHPASGGQKSGPHPIFGQKSGTLVISIFKRIFHSAGRVNAKTAWRQRQDCRRADPAKIHPLRHNFENGAKKHEQIRSRIIQLDLGLALRSQREQPVSGRPIYVFVEEANERRSAMSPLTKKLAAFTLGALISLGLIVWVAQRNFVEQAQQRSGTRLQESVAQVGRSIDEFMLNSIRNTKSIAADPDLSSPDQRVIDKRLSRFTDLIPYFDQLMLVDGQGGIVASSLRSSVDQSLFTNFHNVRDEFELALRGSPGSVYVSDPLRQAVVEGNNRLLNIQFLVPVQDGEGRCIGVVVANVVMRQVVDLLQEPKRRGPGDEFPCLLDQTGHVLMSADPNAPPLTTHDIFGTDRVAVFGRPSGTQAPCGPGPRR